MTETTKLIVENDPTPQITKFVEENRQVLDIIKGMGPEYVIQAWEDFRTKPNVEITPSDVVVIQRDQLEEWWGNIYIHGMTAQNIRDELSDLRMVAAQVGHVYDHVTGGRATKPTTDADVIISLADEHYNNLEEENVDEMLELISSEFDIPVEDLESFR
jgi:hypothetical protein